MQQRKTCSITLNIVSYCFAAQLVCVSCWEAAGGSDKLENKKTKTRIARTLTCLLFGFVILCPQSIQEVISRPVSVWRICFSTLNMLSIKYGYFEEFKCKTCLN